MLSVYTHRRGGTTLKPFGNRGVSATGVFYVRNGGPPHPEESA
jgi:hypothetical protein